MANDADQILVALNAAVHVAPVGTTLPTDSDSALNAAFLELGYTTDDGIQFSDTKTVEDIKAHQSFYPVRRIVTERGSSVSFELEQWNGDTVRLAFGGGTVTEPTSGEYKYVPPDPEDIDERAMVIEWQDGTREYRLVIPRGNVSENVETNLTRKAQAGLPITFAVLGEDATDPWTIFTNDAEWEATGS